MPVRPPDSPAFAGASAPADRPAADLSHGAAADARVGLADEHLRRLDLAGYRAVYHSVAHEFNPISQLVCDFCDASYAGVSFVEQDHVLLKSVVGLTADRIARTGAFCAHAVEDNTDFFEVADTLRDARFAHNGLVLGDTAVRSYAAVPLRTPKGYAIGTLWVMGRQSHALSERQRLLLAAMAKQVMGVMNLSHEDPVTQLPNRRSFLDVLQPLLRSWRADGRSATMAAFEVLEFQVLRDAHGWDAVDRLLAELATRLRAAAAEASGLCSHLGAGQFVVAAPDPLTPGHPLLAETVAALASDRFSLDDAEVRLRMRLGVASFPQDGDSAAALLDQALLAAREAASLGLPVVHCRSEAAAGRKQQAQQVAEVAEGLGANQFFPVLQPQVDLLSGRVTGFEVLARWQRGLAVLEPAQFLQPMGMGQLLPDLDMAMLERACQGMKQWAGADTHSMPPLHCNLSGMTLARSDLIDTIDATLARHGIAHRLVGFEVTESQLLADPAAARQVLDQLAERGCHVSLDDFGTGFSNLLALKELRFDGIKLDRSFIAGVATQRRLQGVFELIQGVARHLGVGLTCEGVESADDLDWLIDHGAHAFQGYFFARPQPFEQAVQKVQRLSAPGTLSADLHSRARCLAAALGEH